MQQVSEYGKNTFQEIVRNSYLKDKIVELGQIDQLTDQEIYKEGRAAFLHDVEIGNVTLTTYDKGAAFEELVELLSEDNKKPLTIYMGDALGDGKDDEQVMIKNPDVGVGVMYCTEKKGQNISEQKRPHIQTKATHQVESYQEVNTFLSRIIYIM